MPYRDETPEVLAPEAWRLEPRAPQAGAEPAAVKRPGALRRWARRLGLSLLAFLGLSIALSLVLRFAPVPVSGLMLERRIESWFDNAAYAPRYDWVPLEAMAPALGAAVIAAEDQKFAEHFGFDWAAIEKAVVYNERRRRTRGASTLSQQTAKNLFLWSERTWLRKGLEAWFTLVLETTWSKRRILEVYLNIVEFGPGIYGAEAAAQAYFRKSAARLTPSEAALLAAVLPNPHRFKADAPSAYVRQRQAWILRQMRQLGGAALVKAL